MVNNLEYNSFFIDQLEKGKKFRIGYLVHYSKWPFLLNLNEIYPNCQIDIFGRSIGYILNRQDITKDYDMILFFSLGHSIEYDLEQLSLLGNEISSVYDKKVTIGYYYKTLIPKKKTTSEIVKIISFEDGNMDSEIIPIDCESFDTNSFLNLVSKKHLETEPAKVKKYI